MKDIEYMNMAISLAEKGYGNVNPNPMVGAVIVKDGIIIGSGYHERYGELHAERNAIASCKESLEGSTIYVTLEPCCHYGKTSPCTDSIIQSKISTVVIGSKDPNRKVCGKGKEALKLAGITVITGVMEDECNKLNEVFFYYIKTKIPFIVMKYAMTLDGKIATYTGKSKWITGNIAREHVHEYRHRYSAIMVGVETVISDNPSLTCRISNGKNPVRIICDTNLRTPLDSQIVKTAKEVPTIIATCCTDIKKHSSYTFYGCEVLVLPKKNNEVDLLALMEKLGEQGIDSILLEGGGTLNYSALKSGIVNKVQAYIAPKIFGSYNAKTPVGGIGIANPEECFTLINKKIKVLGDDILVECEVENNVYRNY